MRSRRRGAALATVLLASGVLLVVCMSLATLAVLDLNLAGSYTARSQGLLMAQAAVNALVAELEQSQRTQTGGATDADGKGRVDLARRYAEKPVFTERAEDFPGQAVITFDQSNDHYSVDNSDNSESAAGWLDRGTTRQSVPAYSIDLVIGVTVGSRTSYYEAILRRRWPYVLTTPGTVTMMGTPTVLDGHAATVNPSDVRGDVFSLAEFDFSTAPPSLEPRQFQFYRGTGSAFSENGLQEADGPPSESEIFVSESMLKSTLQVTPRDLAYVHVGGQADAVINWEGSAQSFTIESTGNNLSGNVDLLTSDDQLGVSVYQDNYNSGSLRRGIEPYDLQRNLKNAFRLPDTADYEEVGRQAPDRPNVEDSDPPASGGTSPAALAATGVAPPRSDGTDYFPLYRDLVLRGKRERTSFSYGSKGRYKISASCGNRYAERRNGAWEMRYTGAGIELHDCILFIKGNLDLSSDGRGESATLPALRGTNATVIVDGTLILNNGSVTASTDGMVLYCRRLVSQAKGTYRGLIMVQKSAAFFPAEPGDVLDIEGAIVCGGAPLSVLGVRPGVPLPGGKDLRYGQPGQGPVQGRPLGDNGQVGVTSPSTTPPPTIAGRSTLQGLHLWSTHLKYDAKYLKTLNRFGPMTLMALRPIE